MRSQIETIQTKALLKSASLLRRANGKLKRLGITQKTQVEKTLNNTHKLLKDFDIHTDHLILARRPDEIIINKNKRTCIIVDFTVPADHRIKLKECEKKDKYLDLARELKKLWNMQVTIVPIVIAAFGTVTRGLRKCLGDLEVARRVETIKTTALLRTARILGTWEDLLSLKLQWKTISVTWCEKL